MIRIVKASAFVILFIFVTTGLFATPISDDEKAESDTHSATSGSEHAENKNINTPLYGEFFGVHLIGGACLTAFGIGGVSYGISNFFELDSDTPPSIPVTVFNLSTSLGFLLIPGVGMIGEFFRLHVQQDKDGISPDENFPFLTYGSIGLFGYGAVLLGIGGWAIGLGIKTMNASSSFEYQYVGGAAVALGILATGCSALFIIPAVKLLIERIELTRRIELLAHTDFFIVPRYQGVSGGIVFHF